MKPSKSIAQSLSFSLAAVYLAVISACSVGDTDSDTDTLASAIGDASADASADDRPDVVLVISDDHRWDLLSAKGHPHLNTPNLDAVVQSGTMMENAFVPVALCSPSRGALLTGRDPHKASTPRIVWTNNSFLQTQRTFAQDMQDAGYETAYIGKWHLGEGSKPKPGFDHWESFDWLGLFFDPEIWINGKPETFNGFVDDILAKRAAHLLNKRRKSSKPLFMVVGLKQPHMLFEHPPRHDSSLVNAVISPPDTYDENFSESGKLQELKDWLGMNSYHCGLNCFDDSWDTYIKSHYRAVLGLDDAIGNITTAINNNGRADNTLFIYTSDNGYSLGDHGLTEKHLVYEEPIRVPLLINAPGNVDNGKIRGELVSTLDIAPTILDYAQISIPKIMTGSSLRPFLESDASDENWRDQLFFMYEKALTAVRTERYKLIKSLQVEGHYELYDLQIDPKETRTLYNDPSYADVRRDMRQRLKSVIQENQWSARKSYPVNALLASNTFPTSKADDIALQLSTSVAELDLVASSESVFNSQVLSWRTLELGSDGAAQDEFGLLPSASIADSNRQSALAVLPLNLLTDWDSFVEIKLPKTAHITVYQNGREIYSTFGEKKPINVANPALRQGENWVVLRIDDTGNGAAAIELEVPEDTMRLPLENNRLLGHSPGRFFSQNEWHPGDGVSVLESRDGLSLNTDGPGPHLQTDNIFIDQPVEMEIVYSTNVPQSAALYWRSENEYFSPIQKASISLPAGSQQRLTVALENISEIDSLRFDFSEELVDLTLINIVVRTEDGSVVRSWNFSSEVPFVAQSEVPSEAPREVGAIVRSVDLEPIL